MAPISSKLTKASVQPSDSLHTQSGSNECRSSIEVSGSFYTRSGTQRLIMPTKECYSKPDLPPDDDICDSIDLTTGAPLPPSLYSITSLVREEVKTMLSNLPESHNLLNRDNFSEIVENCLRSRISLMVNEYTQSIPSNSKVETDQIASNGKPSDIFLTLSPKEQTEKIEHFIKVFYELDKKVSELETHYSILKHQHHKNQIDIANELKLRVFEIREQVRKFMELNELKLLQEYTNYVNKGNSTQNIKNKIQNDSSIDVNINEKRFDASTEKQAPNSDTPVCGSRSSVTSDTEYRKNIRNRECSSTAYPNQSTDSETYAISIEPSLLPQVMLLSSISSTPTSHTTVSVQTDLGNRRKKVLKKKQTKPIYQTDSLKNINKLGATSMMEHTTPVFSFTKPTPTPETTLNEAFDLSKYLAKPIPTIELTLTESEIPTTNDKMNLSTFTSTKFVPPIIQQNAAVTHNSDVINDNDNETKEIAKKQSIEELNDNSDANQKTETVGKSSTEVQKLSKIREKKAKTKHCRHSHRHHHHHHCYRARHRSKRHEVTIKLNLNISSNSSTKSDRSVLHVLRSINSNNNNNTALRKIKQPKTDKETKVLNVLEKNQVFNTNQGIIKYDTTANSNELHEVPRQSHKQQLRDIFRMLKANRNITNDSNSINNNINNKNTPLKDEVVVAIERTPDTSNNIYKNSPDKNNNNETIKLATIAKESVLQVDDMTSNPNPQVLDNGMGIIENTHTEEEEQVYGKLTSFLLAKLLAKRPTKMPTYILDKIHTITPMADIVKNPDGLPPDDLKRSKTMENDYEDVIMEIYEKVLQNENGNGKTDNDVNVNNVKKEEMQMKKTDAKFVFNDFNIKNMNGKDEKVAAIDNRQIQETTENNLKNKIDNENEQNTKHDNNYNKINRENYAKIENDRLNEEIKKVLKMATPENNNEGESLRNVYTKNNTLQPINIICHERAAKLLPVEDDTKCTIVFERQPTNLNRFNHSQVAEEKTMTLKPDNIIVNNTPKKTLKPASPITTQFKPTLVSASVQADIRKQLSSKLTSTTWTAVPSTSQERHEAIERSPKQFVSKLTSTTWTAVPSTSQERHEAIEQSVKQFGPKLTSTTNIAATSSPQERHETLEECLKRFLSKNPAGRETRRKPKKFITKATSTTKPVVPSITERSQLSEESLKKRMAKVKETAEVYGTLMTYSGQASLETDGLQSKPDTPKKIYTGPTFLVAQIRQNKPPQHTEIEKIMSSSESSDLNSEQERILADSVVPFVKQKHGNKVTRGTQIRKNELKLTKPFIKIKEIISARHPNDIYQKMRERRLNYSMYKKSSTTLRLNTF